MAFALTPPETELICLLTGFGAAAQAAMDPKYMQEAMEMMKDPATMKKVPVAIVLSSSGVCSPVDVCCIKVKIVMSYPV